MGTLGKLYRDAAADSESKTNREYGKFRSEAMATAQRVVDFINADGDLRATFTPNSPDTGNREVGNKGGRDYWAFDIILLNVTKSANLGSARLLVSFDTPQFAGTDLTGGEVDTTVKDNVQWLAGKIVTAAANDAYGQVTPRRTHGLKLGT